jgi:MerR family transcriptional regulator, light-induced transcriptional regulator
MAEQPMSGQPPAGLSPAVRAAFERHLARADAEGALTQAVGLVAEGVGAESVLLDLIVPAQRAVGDKWATGRWTTAQEHAASHVSELCTAAVAAAAGRPHGPAPAGEVVVACVEGEWHTLPARILCEVLRLRGLHARFLGGDVRTAELVSDLHRSGPEVVALSCILPARLPQAYQGVAACHRAGIPVLAGGPGFGRTGRWADALGADGYVRDAPGAADLLMAQWPPHLRGAASVDTGSTEEYAWFLGRRPELVRRTAARFATPPGRESVPTADNAGYLLDCLAAGVFVDDPQVFTDCLSYFAEFFAARTVPPTVLTAVVATLAESMQGPRRFAAHLEAGQRSLSTSAGRAGHQPHPPPG